MCNSNIPLLEVKFYSELIYLVTSSTFSIIFPFFPRTNREVCKNEFIIPLGPELRNLYSDAEMCHSLRSLQTESVRPQLRMTEIAYVNLTYMLFCINVQ